MIVVERHFIKGTSEIIRLCTLSKDLYNFCNYQMRQAWFSSGVFPTLTELYHLAKPHYFFTEFCNVTTVQQIIRKLLSDWSNFFKARKVWTQGNPYHKPPNYKEKLAQVIFFHQTIKRKPIRNGLIVPTNDIFTIKSNKKFKQVIITPKTFGFIIEIQYEKLITKPTMNKNFVLNIDAGVINLATITTNQRLQPILINGRILKSINQWYNKHPSNHTSRKRYFRIQNYFHNTSKKIIDYCLHHKISKIIIGRNVGWKQKKFSQNFQYIPYWTLFRMIEYKAKLVNIKVVFTEEAYTSKASFLDNDLLPEYDSTKKHTFSGNRKHRGLYISGDNFAINADVNGSLNIGRKVIPKLEIIGDRSLVARPVRVNPLRVSLVSVSSQYETPFSSRGIGSSNN